MNVFVLTNKPPIPPVDGGAIATLQVIHALERSHHNVTVFYLSTPKHNTPPEIVRKELPERVNVHGARVNTRVNPVGLVVRKKKTPYILSRFYRKDISQHIQNIITETNAELIWIEGLAMTTYLDDIEMPDVKLVFRPHNVESLIWRRLSMHNRSWSKKRLYKRISDTLERYEQNIIHRFDALIPISPGDAAWFSKNKYPGIIRVIPAGIDLNEFRQNSQSPENRKNILFLGALDWKPNVEGILWFVRQVWPEIVKEAPGVSLEIAGRNPAKRIAHKFGADQLIFHGEIADKKEFLRSGKIFIVPLFAGSGIRIKILEAMASGCIVISTSTGAEGLPLENKRHILIADDAETFKKVILRMIHDPDLGNKIIENALHLIREKFDLKTIEPRIDKVINEV